MRRPANFTLRPGAAPMQDWPRFTRCSLVARLLIAGFALLTLAWAFTNPPGAGPDEAANYIKAVGVGQGDLLGVRGPLPPAQAAPFSPDALRLAWSSSTTRWVRVPAHLVPAGFTRSDQRDPAMPNQTEPTYVGTYQPFIYLLSGLVTRLAPDPITALLLARLAGALLCLALLAAAARLLAMPGGNRLSLLGLLLAVTPLVIFVTAAVSASGFEICAGICVFAAVLRLARPYAQSRAPLIVLVIAGTVLALSRPLGVIWLGLDLALLLLLVGPSRLAQDLRRNPRLTAGGALLLLTAAAIGLGWELGVEPHHHTSLAELVYFLPRAIALLPLDLKQAIGIFGWLDSWMPGGAYFLWMAALAALLLGALLIGSRRQRLVLGSLVAANLGVALAIGAAIIMPIGSPLQARYFLAFALTIPLYAGEVLALNAGRLRPTTSARLAGALLALAATTQAIALVTNTVHLGGSLPDYARVFTPVGRWAPPLGSTFWVGVGLLGCMMLIAAGAAAFRHSGTAENQPPARASAAA